MKQLQTTLLFNTPLSHLLYLLSSPEFIKNIHYKATHYDVDISAWNDADDAIVDDVGKVKRCVVRVRRGEGEAVAQKHWHQYEILEVLTENEGSSSNNSTAASDIIDAHAPKAQILSTQTHNTTIPISTSKHYTRTMSFYKNITNILPSVLSYSGMSGDVRCSATESIELRFGRRVLPGVARRHSGEELLIEEEEESLSTPLSTATEHIESASPLLPKRTSHNDNQHLIQFVNTTNILIDGREDAMELGVRLVATEVQCIDDECSDDPHVAILVDIHFWSHFKKTVWGFTQMIDNLIFQQTEISYHQWLDLVQRGIRAMRHKTDGAKWNALLPLIDYEAEIASEPLVYFDMRTGESLSLAELEGRTMRRSKDTLATRRGMHQLLMSTTIDLEHSEPSAAGDEEEELALQDVSNIPSNMSHTILSPEDESEDEEFFDAETDVTLLQQRDNTPRTPVSAPLNPSSSTPKHMSIRQMQQRINELTFEAQQTEIKLHQLHKMYSNQRIQESVDEFLDQLNGIWKQCQLSYDTLMREKKYHERMYETLLNRSFDQIQSITIGFASGFMFAVILWLLRDRLRWGDYFGFIWRLLQRVMLRVRAIRVRKQ